MPVNKISQEYINYRIEEAHKDLDKEDREHLEETQGEGTAIIFDSEFGYTPEEELIFWNLVYKKKEKENKMDNYYDTEIQSIEPKKGENDIIKIKLMSSDKSTKWIDLNPQSLVSLQKLNISCHLQIQSLRKLNPTSL